MTLAQLEADPTFERNLPELPAPDHSTWVAVAEAIIATPHAVLAKFTHSERESHVIGLRNLDDYRCRKALRLLEESSPKPGRKADA